MNETQKRSIRDQIGHPCLVLLCCCLSIAVVLLLFVWLLVCIYCCAYWLLFPAAVIKFLLLCYGLSQSTVCASLIMFCCCSCMYCLLLLFGIDSSKDKQHGSLCFVCSCSFHADLLPASFLCADLMCACYLVLFIFWGSYLMLKFTKHVRQHKNYYCRFKTSP